MDFKLIYDQSESVHAVKCGEEWFLYFDRGSYRRVIKGDKAHIAGRYYYSGSNHAMKFDGKKYIDVESSYYQMTGLEYHLLQRFILNNAIDPSEELRKASRRHAAFLDLKIGVVSHY